MVIESEERGKYPNMPRYQRCPQCHSNAKRKEKTLGGANYTCHKCRLQFFVKGLKGK